MNALSLIHHQYNATQIDQREQDGYLNATAMCQANGKKINHYLSNESTDAFIQALSSETGIPASQLVQAKKGNSKDFTQGTWVHPLVAVNLAQWLSPQFAVWCSKLIYGVVLEHKTLRVSPEQQGELRHAVADKVNTLVASGQVNPSGLFQALYGALKRKYGVAKYDQIPARHFDEAMDFISRWTPVDDKLPARIGLDKISLFGNAADVRIRSLKAQGVDVTGFDHAVFAALQQKYRVQLLNDIPEADVPEALNFILTFTPVLALPNAECPFSPDQIRWLARLSKIANQNLTDPTCKAGQTGRFGLALQWALEDML